MSDSSDLRVADTVIICEEWSREVGRMDREDATSKRLDICDRSELQP